MGDEIGAGQAEARVATQARELAEQLVAAGSPGAQPLWELRRQAGRLRRVKGSHKCWPVAGITAPDNHKLGGRTWSAVLRDDGELRLAAVMRRGRLATPTEFGRPSLPDAEVWLSVGDQLSRVAREHGIGPGLPALEPG